MIINQHEWAGGPGSRCVYCGTMRREEGGSPLSCFSREVQPEPELRGIACEDGDAISARLAELAAERQAILNRPEEDPAAAPSAQTAAAAIDPGDCCF